MTSTGAVNYNSFIDNLHASGLKTTSLSSGETNFQQYGKALDDSLEQELLQSFDNNQDYVLQQKIATLFKNRSVMNSGEFISACQSLGLSCSVSYESTTYISDYKAGNTSGSASGGHIAIYTISDGNGGEIKIADANGNGALECEELFMNQILGDINTEINMGMNDTTKVGAVNEKTNPPQELFNAKVEEYLNIDFDMSRAIELANIILGTDNMEYTGDFKKVSQEEFNQEVEKHMKKGCSEEEATSIVKKEYDVSDIKYTGDGIKEAKKEEIESNIIITAAGVSYKEPEKTETKEPVAEEVIEEATVEEPVAEEVTVEEPVAEEVTVDEPVAEEVTVDEPIAEEVTVEEPVAEEITVEEPVAEEAIEEEIKEEEDEKEN